MGLLAGWVWLSLNGIMTLGGKNGFSAFIITNLYIRILKILEGKTLLEKTKNLKPSLHFETSDHHHKTFEGGMGNLEIAEAYNRNLNNNPFQNNEEGNQLEILEDKIEMKNFRVFEINDPIKNLKEQNKETTLKTMNGKQIKEGLIYERKENLNAEEKMSIFI